ncbi:hypothetical protein BXZ70DRAFT_1037829 [Cristinia sonorae]|uniref:F-box domain-containing protein n=1 Tax=Cristinia sonorae TaxID=1940300 RepID=A0A8K0UYL2_9AGAR|nr:hypothetical protein BXZ70DRAFT_1037829 [Cristinia sonorae]
MSHDAIVTVTKLCLRLAMALGRSDPIWTSRRVRVVELLEVVVLSTPAVAYTLSTVRTVQLSYFPSFSPRISMSDEHSELAVLNAKVASLEGTILAAFQELQIVKSQLQSRQTHGGDGPDAPQPSSITIHSVPDEVLIQIFSAAVYAGADRVSSPQDARDALRCAVAISHVCRLWRDAAMHTSTLWTHIMFTRNLRGVKTCLGRSKTQPLTIVRHPSNKRYPTLPEKQLALKSYVEATSSRWLNVHWISSDITMRNIISELNRLPSFPCLTVLDLVVDNRRLFGPRVGSADAEFSESPDGKFPTLEHLRLTQVSPSDLPPVKLPTLRTLCLHFPHKQQAGEQRDLTHLLRMSGLCAILFRAPNLEELIIDDSIILMDIRLRPYNNDAHGPPVDRGRRETHHVVSPISMDNLTRFQWDFAPARDLWRFFYFIRMPSLRQLDIVLDRSDERWLQLRGGLVSAIGNIQPISELLTYPVVRFDMLEDLRVECLDTDGLSSAFRKLDFPNLRTLSLTFVELNVPMHQKYHRSYVLSSISSQLPRAESIFRDPRLPNLVSLELTNFHLDGPHTKGTLLYMPALERLSLESCTNAGEIVRALNSLNAPPPSPCTTEGATAQQETSLPGEEWLCPNLEHLALKKCKEVDPVDLMSVICQRRLWSMVQSQVGTTKRVFIPLRTRKRAKLHGDAHSHSPSPGSPPSTPDAARARPALPPSPGTWKSHERKKPRMLRTVYVEGCGVFDEGQVEAMRRDAEEVVYIP